MTKKTESINAILTAQSVTRQHAHLTPQHSVIFIICFFQRQARMVVDLIPEAFCLL